MLWKILLLVALVALPARCEGLSLRLQVYDAGKGPVRFILKVENLTGAPVTITQPSSQTHDFAVTRGSEEIWRWSADKYFMQMLTERVFQPGETVTYTGEWERGMPGRYEVRAWLPVVEGEPPQVRRFLTL